MPSAMSRVRETAARGRTSITCTGLPEAIMSRTSSTPMPWASPNSGCSSGRGARHLARVLVAQLERRPVHVAQERIHVRLGVRAEVDVVRVLVHVEREDRHAARDRLPCFSLWSATASEKRRASELREPWCRVVHCSALVGG